MNNPYYITGPALVRVSGGRTSGFMLRRILDAHGGTLPDDVVPIFCNTGKEHEATLQFVRDIGVRWTSVVWLEYRASGDPESPHAYTVVDYCSASRKGEPFEQVIAHRGMVPYPRGRFCTGELKTRTGNRYAKGTLGWTEWTSVVGLRADEPDRAMSITPDEAAEELLLPMYRAGHCRDDVLAFWRTQEFDLMLPGNDNAFGNCTLCFAKRRARIENVMRTMPEEAEWWAQMEESTGTRFRIDRPTYRQMMTQLTVQGRLLDDSIEDDTMPCMCHD